MATRPTHEHDRLNPVVSAGIEILDGDLAGRERFAEHLPVRSSWLDLDQLAVILLIDWRDTFGSRMLPDLRGSQ